MRSTPRRLAGERLRRAGRQFLDPADWRAGAAIEDLDQRGVPASGCRDDIGHAIVVHVADGEREPAGEYAVEGDERPEDAAGGAVDDLNPGPPARGPAGDDVRVAVADQVRRGQGDAAAVSAA